jgi:hypothetical protein
MGKLRCRPNVRLSATLACIGAILCAGAFGSAITAGPALGAVSTGTTTPPAPTVIGWASSSLVSVSTDEADFGKKNGMLSTYADFVNSPAFPVDYAAAAASRSAALLVAWEPWDWSNPSVNQPAFRPKDIAAGSQDAYISSWLKTAQTYARSGTIMIRFAPEMNDAGRPWSVGVNGGNTAGDYVNMWRHVYDLKKSLAPDVIMVWNPLVAGSKPDGTPVSFSSVYPGSDHVDMLALDGFNWGGLRSPGTCGWQSYADVFGGPVAQIKALANGKPWGIAETASASRPDSYFEPGGVCYSAWGSWVYNWPASPPHYATASDWITQAGWMKTLMQNAHDDGASFVNMFNTTKETDWRLNSTPEGSKVLGLVGTDPGFVFGQQGSAAYLKSLPR